VVPSPACAGSLPASPANKYGMTDIEADMSSKPYIYIDNATGQ